MNSEEECPFQVGDRVICIDNSQGMEDSLQIGQEFQVAGIETAWGYGFAERELKSIWGIQLAGRFGLSSAKRFKLANPEQPLDIPGVPA